jgi:hypothetical protein
MKRGIPHCVRNDTKMDVIGAVILSAAKNLNFILKTLGLSR